MNILFYSSIMMFGVSYVAANQTDGLEVATARLDEQRVRELIKNGARVTSQSLANVITNFEIPGAKEIFDLLVKHADDSTILTQRVSWTRCTEKWECLPQKTSLKEFVMYSFLYPSSWMPLTTKQVSALFSIGKRENANEVTTVKNHYSEGEF